MPKRIGFLMRKVKTLENCTAAVLEGTENLRKTRAIRRIRSDPEKYGKRILKIIENGWVPEPTRTKIINEGTGHKVRRLQIPTTRDHLVHVAILRVIIPIIQRRLDFYCCGSVPGRGQKRVGYAIKGWMSGDKPAKYGAEADVHHAYESTDAEIIMSCLRSFIKDEEYLREHEKILCQMGGKLAIGFSPSHWYFNLIMTQVDQKIRQKCKGIKLVRFMDNYVFAGNRKRTLHRSVEIAISECGKMGLSINRNWQVYPTEKRAISMLSYRYFKGYTILKKSTMYAISARLKTAANNPCAHLARGAMSRIGILRHCNSYNYRKNHVYPVISIKQCKELISRDDKKRLLLGAA